MNQIYSAEPTQRVFIHQQGGAIPGVIDEPIDARGLGG